MTQDERKAINEAIRLAYNQLDGFDNLVNWNWNDEEPNLEDLYQAAKPVHEAALGIWSTVVNILRARKGLNPREPETDAINLKELFGEKENANG